MDRRFKKSVLTEVEIFNPKFRRLVFRAQDSDFTFKPGQFVIMKIDKTTFRDYSVASLPKELPKWEVIIDITPNGPGCRYLKNLRLGKSVETSKPTGAFLLNPNFENYLLVATGSGIASIRPLANQLMAVGKKLFLFWGLRFPEDIFLAEEIDSWGGEIILSRPNGNWKGKTGHVTKYVTELAKTLPVAKSCAYICGNKNMMADVQLVLKKSGYQKKQIYFESYFL